MRSFPLGLSLLFFVGVVGCSTETSGLLDDGFADTSIEEDTLDEDASADVEGDTGVVTTDSGTDTRDATVTETGADSGKDVAADGADVTLLDGADVAVDVPTIDGANDTADSAVTADSADASTADTAPGADTADTAPGADTADSAPIDTGTAATDTGSLALAPQGGKVVCGSTTCNARPDWCCGRIQFNGSYAWSCEATFCEQRDYICDEKADCSGGDKCCAKMEGFPTAEIRGSQCSPDCGSGPQLCMTNAECAPKTCVARNVPDGPQTIGVCQ